MMCTREHEQELTAQGYKYIVGIDEVGRGALAGPVTVCACYIPLDVEIKGINDSKKLSEKRREAISKQLTEHKQVKFAIIHIGNETVDQINILQATFEGMYQSFTQLQTQLPEIDCVLIDGNSIPPQFKRNTNVHVKTVIGGDGLCCCIGAASIIAKVARDNLMKMFDTQYPGYNLGQHKGYGSAKHMAAIRELGPTPIHRKTFRGVKHED